MQSILALEADENFSPCFFCKQIRDESIISYQSRVANYDIATPYHPIIR